MKNLNYYIIAIFLFVVWVFAFFTFNLGAYIHLLLVIAVITLILCAIQDEVKLIVKKRSK